MIKSWLHKELQNFFETGSKAGIPAAHPDRLSERLLLLNRAKDVKEMNLPAYRLHQLKGDRNDIWSARVSGNRLLTFQFVESDAYAINYEDCH